LKDFSPSLSLPSLKNGPNQKKNAHYYTIMQIRVFDKQSAFIFFILPNLEKGAKIFQKLGSFFGRFEDTTIPFRTQIYFKKIL
jgi:hypothetical protein